MAEHSDEAKRLTLLIFAFSYLFFEPWALCLLWRWFALPLGAVAVGYWQMAGLNVMVSLFCWRFIPKKDDLDTKLNIAREQWSMGLAALVVGFLFSLGVQ